MKNIILSFLFISTASLFVSCDNDKDTDPPIIEIMRPAENQVFVPGDDLGLYLKISDKAGIEMYSYEIFNENDSEKTSFTIKKEFFFNYLINEITQMHIVSVPEEGADKKPLVDGTYKIKVIAKDVYGYKATQMRTVLIKNKVASSDK